MVSDGSDSPPNHMQSLTAVEDDETCLRIGSAAARHEFGFRLLEDGLSRVQAQRRPKTPLLRVQVCHSTVACANFGSGLQCK
mmetsp:Transcript_12243/g.27759  ORF Transcript_12243/g.27759 Transcript_12243/m.27759 type:complete len:82 (+) Transcript_12243:62-307(+)